MSPTEAIILAFVATVLINLGFALQKRGASLAELPDGGRRKLVTIRVWRTGLFIMLAGWAMYFVSARFAPISVIQSVLGAGLAALALFSVFYLKEKVSAAEWAAFAAMMAGVTLLGLSAGEAVAAPAPRALPVFGFSAAVAAAAAGLFVLGRRETAARPGVTLGLAAGLLIGLGSMHIKALYNFAGPEAAAGGSDLIAFGLCLPLLIAGNILGIVVVQYGFRKGRALVVVPVQQVTNKVIVILGGMLTLGESLPADPLDAGMRVAGFALVILATAALARFGQ